jgi:hypothetical protein
MLAILEFLASVVLPIVDVIGTVCGWSMGVNEMDKKPE